MKHNLFRRIPAAVAGLVLLLAFVCPLSANAEGKTLPLDFLEGGKPPKADGGDIYRQIEAVIHDAEKGLSVDAIALKRGLDRDLAEQIVRLYVTHPGVTADGIMEKMGLLGKL